MERKKTNTKRTAPANKKVVSSTKTDKTKETPLKAKRGQPKKIKTPEELWDAFERYKIEVKSNPIKVHDFRGKDADEVYVKKEKPLTMEGFTLFCYENKIHAWVKDYFNNKNNYYDAYSTVCTLIKEKIRDDQVSGGMAGIYNPSITQRLNNLTEKQEIEQTVTEKKQIFKIGDQEISFE